MTEKKEPIDRVVRPIQRFMRAERAGGIVLGISVIIAMVIANSPLADDYFRVLGHKFGFIFNGVPFFEYNIHHWINDGLMAIFFFVVGLELKREFVAGELSNFRKAMLPIGAAFGGMLVPALIYFSLNPFGDASSGWGIPMATDIAFALGVLYLLGRRIPTSLKVFLTALAIVDDLGAVVVIALFYTSEISLSSLATGLGFALVLFIGNKIGVRSLLFYVTVGVLGVWASFLMSGVHATIAAVIAAFMVPADVKISENLFVERIKKYLNTFRDIDPKDEIPTLTNEQLHLLEKIKVDANKAIPPLQRLEYNLHPLVIFVIVPLFALANAGVSLDLNWEQLFSTNIAFGVALGLLLGKVCGVVGATLLLVKLKVAPLPSGMNRRNLLGLGFLASIGFTMSLFVTSLAFTNTEYMVQAKIGIFVASIIGGVIGYLILNKSHYRA